MKKLLFTLVIVLPTLALGGCLASTYSPDGVNCNYSQEKPLWEMPLDCQTGR
jgi:hypothetical protein